MITKRNLFLAVDKTILTNAFFYPLSSKELTYLDQGAVLLLGDEDSSIGPQEYVLLDREQDGVRAIETEFVF